MLLSLTATDFAKKTKRIDCFLYYKQAARYKGADKDRRWMDMKVGPERS